MKKIDEKLAAEISLKKPAVSNSRLSNSRLSGQTLGKSQPALSFDAMTIVGNLNKTNAKKLSDFMSVEPQIRLWDILQTKFKAKALQEKVYIEYDKVKADTWDRRNMRVEFNPNKLTHEEMIWLKQNIIDYMEDDGFTRLDLAFDFEDDLSDYYAMTDKAVKKTVFMVVMASQKQNILVSVIVIDLLEFIIKNKNVKITQMLKLCLNIYGV
ncbi:hypothetical protein [Enterococcus faecalis]|uniref:hypothetical protein n=1 Tax=Enterococcus faecalis TaxID=1351 RepID=UPI003F8D3CB0